MTYKFRDGFRGAPVPAQVAGEEIERIRQASNGDVTPQRVVDEARPTNAALHPAFDWDDTTAAESWRKQQARNLVGALVVTFSSENDEHEVRAFVSVSRDEDPAYTSVSVAMSDAALRAQVVGKALAELKAWKRRYSDYSELAQYHAAIEAAKPAALPG